MPRRKRERKPTRRDAPLPQEVISVIERIESRRVAKGIKPSRLAGLAGVSQPTMSNILGFNNAPAIETVFAIADALGVRAGWLMDGEGLPESGARYIVLSPAAATDEEAIRSALKLAEEA